MARDSNLVGTVTDGPERVNPDFKTVPLNHSGTPPRAILGSNSADGQRASHGAGLTATLTASGLCALLRGPLRLRNIHSRRTCYRRYSAPPEDSVWPGSGATMVTSPDPSEEPTPCSSSFFAIT